MPVYIGNTEIQNIYFRGAQHSAKTLNRIYFDPSLAAPSVSEVQYLLIAGGGGGGFNWGGGGGAGGTISGTLDPSSFVEGNTYTVIVGAGGNSDSQGGSTSLSGTGIDTLSTTGGGRGGTRTGGGGTTGGAGGSGGGGAYASGQGGAGISGQGFAGAAGPVWPQYGGGGGGGASETPLRPQGNSAVSTPPEASGGEGIEWPLGSGDLYAGGGGAAHQGNDTTYTIPWGGGGNDPTQANLNGLSGTGGGGSGTYTTTGGSGGSGVVKLRYESDTFIGYGGEMTTDGTSKVHSFYYSSFFVKDTPTFPSSNLVVHYDAGNTSSYPGTGTTVTDLQGNVNGTLSGVGYDAADGGAFTFGADGDYINLGNNTLNTYLNGSVNFTVGFWANITAHGYILDQGNLGTDGTGCLEFRSNTWGRNNDSNGFGISPDWSGTAIDPINRGWHFIVGTKNGNQATLYLDGMLSNQETEANTFSGSGLWKIGRRAFNTSTAFGGKISQVFVYNTALTPNEVAQLYASTNRY